MTVINYDIGLCLEGIADDIKNFLTEKHTGTPLKCHPS
jgi:hypothetical protein